MIYRVTKKKGFVGIRDGLANMEHFSDLPLPPQYHNSVGALIGEVIKNSGGVSKVGLKLYGFLQNLSFSVLNTTTKSTVYDSPEDIKMLQNWYQPMLTGYLGQQSLKQKLLTPLELEQLIEALGNLPEDPTAICVLDWIEYVAQKN